MSDLAIIHPPLSSTTGRPNRHGVAAAAALGGRGLRLSLRNVDGLVTALALPIMLMLLFVYLFGGAIDTGGRYVDYVVSGVLIVCAGFGAATTAVTVSHDLSSGIIDRFRSIDVRGEVLVASHVAASVARNVVSTTLVLAVAVAIGFRPHASAAAWFAAIGILVLFVLALSWWSAAIGIVARSPEAASGFGFFVSFLPYPSSAFVPVSTMPSWMRGFATHQPVSAVVDSLRALLMGSHAPAGVHARPLEAVAWSLAIIVGSMVLAGVLFRRRVG